MKHPQQRLLRFLNMWSALVIEVAASGVCEPMRYSSTLDNFDYCILQLCDIGIYLCIIQSRMNHCNNS